MQVRARNGPGAPESVAGEPKRTPGDVQRRAGCGKWAAVLLRTWCHPSTSDFVPLITVYCGDEAHEVGFGAVGTEYGARPKRMRMASAGMLGSFGHPSTVRGKDRCAVRRAALSRTARGLRPLLCRAPCSFVPRRARRPVRHRLRVRFALHRPGRAALPAQQTTHSITSSKHDKHRQEREDQPVENDGPAVVRTHPLDRVPQQPRDEKDGTGHLQMRAGEAVDPALDHVSRRTSGRCGTSASTVRRPRCVRSSTTAARCAAPARGAASSR